MEVSSHIKAPAKRVAGAKSGTEFASDGSWSSQRSRLQFRPHNFYEFNDSQATLHIKSPSQRLRG